MIVRYSQVVHSPIVEIRSQSLLGKVSEVVLQKSDFSVKAVLFKSSPLSLERRVVTETDILEITPQAVLVNDENSSESLSESPRVQQSLKTKSFGVGQKVVTKSKKRVGRVVDFTFDSQIMKIQNLYVKSMLSDRIIPSTVIEKVEGKTITISDDFEVSKAAQPAPKTA